MKVLNKKKKIFLMRKFIVYIEIIPKLKNAVLGEVVRNSKKIKEESYILIHSLKYIL